MVQTKISPLNVTLTLGLPEQMFQMAHLHVMVNNCVKLFSNPSTNVDVMIKTNSDTHEGTDASTYTKMFLYELCLPHLNPLPEDKF